MVTGHGSIEHAVSAMKEGAVDYITKPWNPEALRIAVRGPSLGGVETLVSRPAALSHSSMSPEERDAVGIRDELIRVSVGIEDAGDLIADFDQALE